MIGRRDLSALSRPLSRAAAVELTADLPRTREKPPVSVRDLSAGSRIVMGALTVVQWVAVGLLTLGLAYAAVALVRESIRSPRGTLPVLVLLLAVAIAGVTAAIIEGRRGPVRRARLVLLAQENGWDFEPLAYPPRGALFTFGTERTVHDRIRIRRAPRVEIAEYSCRVDAGKSSTVVRYAYLALALPQALPHIVLDSLVTSGRRRSPLVLTAGFAADQRLSLEGDFDQHFHLYAPKGYERDALYLFTPDIMALFIDRAGSYDVEIIDGWLYLYGLPATLTEPTPERWEATLALIDALDAKLDQWDRWRDDAKKSTRRFAPAKPGVAPAGARLRPVRLRDKLRRTSVMVGVLVMILGLAGAVILPMLGF